MRYLRAQASPVPCSRARERRAELAEPSTSGLIVRPSACAQAEQGDGRLPLKPANLTEILDRLALGAALVVVTGYVDAVGFLELGHLFVSFMSGDSTQFAVAGGQFDWATAGDAGAIIALFVGGVAIGRAIERLAGAWRRTVVLLAEAALLGAAAAIGPSLPTVVVLMVVAMGLQNSAIHRAGDTELSLTYVTGVLVNLGQRAVDALGAKDAKARWAWAPYLLLWIALAGGSAAGAAAFGPWRLEALFIPAAVLALLAGVTAAVAAKGDDERPAAG